MTNRIVSLFCFILGCPLFLTAQQNITSSEVLTWTNVPFSIVENSTESPLCNECAFDEIKGLPVFGKSYPLTTAGKLRAKIVNPNFIPYNGTLPTDFNQTEILVNASIGYERKKPMAIVSFVPIVKTMTGFQQLVDFDLELTVSPKASNSVNYKTTASTTESVLNQGTFYRFATTQDGIYKIDKAFLQNLGVTVSSINMDNLRIYGNGGGMLPELAGEARPDDLIENPIEVVDANNNNSFDDEDYVLFYGQSPNQWQFNNNDKTFAYQTHLYANQAFYFLNFDIGSGARIALVKTTNDFDYETNSYDALRVQEEEKVNILKSGRIFLGNEMSHGNDTKLNFNIPHLQTNTPLAIKLRLAARSTETTNDFELSINGQLEKSYALGSVGVELGSEGGRWLTDELNKQVNNSNFEINVRYGNDGASGRGYIDFINIHARADLTLDQTALTNGQLIFRDAQNIAEDQISRFTINTPVNSLKIWDITNEATIGEVEVLSSGSQSYFTAPTSSLKTFIAFDQSQYLTPTPLGVIAAQNLHADIFPDFIIVGHPEFEAQMNELANFHREEDNMNVLTVMVQEVYNEFSSGMQDISAIRDFVKLFYDRAETEDQLPKHLLLFGDCSYDFKNLNHTAQTNENFVPIFESKEPFNKTTNFCSDDFFGLLDDNEGDNLTSSNERVDIGIGRFPVRSANEAQGVINKIKHYKSPASTGAWTNNLTFVADDGDGNLHFEDTESHTQIFRNLFNNYNIDKIYLDAFTQQSGQGGETYPDVNKAIQDKIFNGSFIMNYAGHGKETGWCKENVLNSNDIINLTNFDKLPLFITATCTFTKVDDPDIHSAGELLLTNPNGGAIAIVSTVRVVFASANKDINENFLLSAFNSENGVHPTLGIATMQAKNAITSSASNARKFALFGDPALTLNFPTYGVQTTQIFNETLEAENDTARALNKVTISGEIINRDGNLVSDYNGILTPVIFDKEQSLTTLGNDLPATYDPDTGDGCYGPELSCPETYKLQQNIIFRGNASVTNGVFSFSFVVPKDISYAYGEGKISYFAVQDDVTAAGYDTDIIIGGISNTVNTDNEGPEVRIYFNDENFVFGGLTNEDPTLIVKLEDENGINTVGTGIGHDLTAYLDEEDSANDQRFILNNYYNSELDNFQKGEVVYPLSDLEPGLHTMRVKAWDVYNNSGEAFSEFVVAESAELALARILNYPNPFTDKTNFWLEHNRPGDLIKVKIQIFTISGRLVKSFHEEMASKGTRIDHIEWNGLDEFGNQIGRGVYIYQITITDSQNESVTETQKLVLLK